MKMQSFVNSYKDGLNQDLSPNNYPNTYYYDLQNFRVITSEEDGTTGALRNIKGMSASFTIPDSGTLLGYTILRDYLIILVTTGEAIPDRIYRIPLSALKTANDLTLTNTYYWNAVDTDVDTLVYKADLNFNTSNPIQVIANYETPTVQKIYWIDGLNAFRHLNTVNNDDTNPLETLDSELLELVPENDYGSFDLTLQEGGRLKAGKVQYSYQLYAINGTETMFSPASGMINLTASPTSPASSYKYQGSELEEYVNKAVAVEITLPASTQDKFNRLRLVALDYEAYAILPTVRIVSEVTVGSTEIYITDMGTSIGTMTLEEFRFIQNEIIPKTLESYKNFLFPGNITQKYFDVDDAYTSCSGVSEEFLDTRVYRFRSSSVSGADDYIYYNIAQNPTAMSLTTGGAWEVDYISGAKDGLGAGTITVVDWSIIDNTDSFTINTTTRTETTDWVAEISNVKTAENIRDDIINNVTGFSATALAGVVTVNANQSYNIEIFSTTADAAEMTVSTGTFVEAKLPIYGLSKNATHINMIYYGTPYNVIRLKLSGLVLMTYNPATDAVHIAGTGYIAGYEPTQNYDNGDIGDMSVLETGMTYEALYSGPATYKCYVNRQDDDKILAVTAPNFDEPPETHDCVNTFNWLENDFRDEDEFIYNSSGAALGGSGKYIDFVFDETKTVSFGASEIIEVGGFIKDTNPYENYLDDDYVINYTGYQRDEVYRWGIIWYDLQGRPSYVKWIADIRNPRIEESNPFDGELSGHILALKFTIKWSDLDSDFRDKISGIQFVRAERTEFDKTIKAFGMITCTTQPTKDNADANYYSTNTLVSVDDYNIPRLNIQVHAQEVDENSRPQVIDLIAPEIAFNKEITPGVDGFIQVCAFGKWGTEVDTEFFYTLTNRGIGVQEYVGTNKSNITDLRQDIDEYIIALPEAETAAVHTINGTVPYKSRLHNTAVAAADAIRTYKGTSLIAHIPAVFTNLTSLGDTNNYLVGYYRVDLGYSIYGGNTYGARSYSEYIPAGAFQETTSADTDYTTYGGDTYLCMYTHLRGGWDENITGGTAAEDGQFQTYYTFPVETGININCRSDIIENYVQLESADTYKLAEYASDGISMFPDDYPDIGDLNRYNSAYSAQDKSKTFFAEPFDFQNQSVFDTRITSSDQKIVNEYSDSWTKFRFNNYIDLEGEQGSLIKIINQNNKLFAFQERGISVLPIQEREVIQSNNTAELVVGTGGVLERFDYLSKSAGSTLYDAIALTDNGIYFYDDNNIIIYRLGEKLEPLSDIKGMKSYLNSTKPSNMILGYDKANREVLFSSDDFAKTLVYSGYGGYFGGFFTFKDNAGNYPSKYIMFDKYLLSTTDDNKYYLHNVGNYGTFYDETTPFSSTLTLITNPQGSQRVSSMYMLEWLTDLYNGATEIKRTFTDVQMWDTYQDTGILPLTYFDEDEMTGTHTGGDGFGTLQDNTQSWGSDIEAAFEAGGTVILKNLTDHSSGLINQVTGQTISLFPPGLAGGTDNDWDTGDMYEVVYDSGILSRRLRKWKYNLLRDSGDDGRIRDSYVKTKFRYNNADNYKLTVYDIITSWKPTKV